MIMNEFIFHFTRSEFVTEYAQQRQLQIISFYRFALMACCWLGVPEERPTFVQLLACLQEFYTALGRYI
jgi:hypothetical protein